MPTMNRSTNSNDWNARITEAVTDSDAARSNRKITNLHFELGRALRSFTGSGAGANFHAWAVWGSSKAGESIRCEGLGRAKRDAAIAGSIVGFAIGGLVAGWIGGVFLAIVLATAGLLFVRRGERRATRLVLAGNRLVLDEIGRVTARFVEAFQRDRKRDEAKLNRFLATIDAPLLKQAFSHYYFARFAATVPARQEAACLANCLAVYHEHVRLQPYIAGALPWGLRRYATARFMGFRVGELKLEVTEPLAHGSTTAPAGVDPAAWNLLFGPSGVAQRPGAAARDWSNIHQRMNFVTALFRTLHADAEVFADPNGVQFRLAATGRNPVSRDAKSAERSAVSL